MLLQNYTRFIKVETGYGLLAVTIGLSALAIAPRWDSVVQYCVPNSECRVVKEVDPNTFDWHQQQARENAEKLLARKKTKKKTDKWYSLAQNASQNWDKAAYDFNEGWNDTTHMFSPQSTKEFLKVTRDARRQGYQLTIVGELPGYGVWRKVAGAFSLITVGGLIWVVAKLEEFQPQRDAVAALDVEAATTRHQRALSAESTVISAEIDWEVAAGQKQLEAQYLGEDADEFLETLDEQVQFVDTRANNQEKMLKQLTGTQTLDSINTPSDKVTEADASPSLTEGQVEHLSNALMNALKTLGHPSILVSPTIGHTIIEITVKPSDATKINQMLKLGQPLQVEMKLKAPPTITTVAGGVAIALPRPDRLVALFDKYVPEQRIEGIPKLVVGVDVYNKLHEYDLSSKAVESMIIGGIPKAGKSQLIISMIACAMRRYSPDQVKFLLFDGKEGVELGFLDGNPYLVRPVASVSNEVQDSLEWYAEEIAERFKLFKSKGVTNLDDYNNLSGVKKLPYVVAIADEIQSLFNLEKPRNEGGHLDIIASIASLGRAAGMPLILATQAPDRKLINRQIAAKCNSRIALKVESEGDSQLIVRAPGAENLLAKGDLLYRNAGEPPVRLQGLYIPEGERNKIFGESNKLQQENDGEPNKPRREYSKEEFLNQAKKWLNDVWMLPDTEAQQVENVDSNELSNTAQNVLSWLMKNRKPGQWVKFKGRESRDSAFITFLSDNGISSVTRDAVIQELIKGNKIMVNEAGDSLALVNY